LELCVWAPVLSWSRLFSSCCMSRLLNVLIVFCYDLWQFFAYGWDHEVYTKKEMKILALCFSVTSMEEYASTHPERVCAFPDLAQSILTEHLEINMHHIGFWKLNLSWLRLKRENKSMEVGKIRYCSFITCLSSHVISGSWCIPNILLHGVHSMFILQWPELYVEIYIMFSSKYHFVLLMRLSWACVPMLKYMYI
jgi:hypothetical protein